MIERILDENWTVRSTTKDLFVSNTPPLWAHTPAPSNGQWHDLQAHLIGTAELARRFAAPFGGGEVAYWLGALHDVGKAACVWQERLAAVAGTDRPVGVDHKALGTHIAIQLGAGPLAMAIYGHHGGLIDRTDLTPRVATRLREHPANEASARRELACLLPDLPDSLRPLVPASWHADPLTAELAIRLCYSALVDADSLDTSAHFHCLSQPRVRGEADFDQLLALSEKRRAELLGNRSAAPVDRLREQVYTDCLRAADKAPGVFRLGAPTGAGKTMASAAFALRHAARHGKSRVIVAVPFLTITEQNAAVYRKLLNEDGAEPVVLEHHSQANFDDGKAGRWARLAAENWDAPFVVTTFVRLFESLFGRKPSAMRRVHRLANAVIVLDEVQALPHRMLAPILDGLRQLVTHFNTTVVLSSATQPSFWSLKEFDGIECTDLIPDTPTLVNDLRRVRFEWQLDPRPTLSDIAEQAAAETAALVVVNTTANAKAIFDRWRELVPTGVAWHLSTRMCPAHRQRVLDHVRQLLGRKEPVLLVSTQLIEAGVDVDFPVVFRAMAPADSLLQAAGRANRDGHLAIGRVIIFDPADGGEPPTYRSQVNCTTRHFGPTKADPDCPTTLERYYPDLYDVLRLDDALQVGQRIQAARRKWQFQTVSDGPEDDHGRNRKLAFRMIDDDGISVVTPQGAETPDQQRELTALIERLRHDPLPEVATLRALQPYTTNVHVSALRRVGVNALMAPILGTEIHQGALVEWRGEYDPDTGIEFDPHLEDFIL
jgi:CRISPR-associated endonuclease/helicase Cas3